MAEHEVLGSWKEIADYLGKEIHTCWRWEKELGLPVHRIDSHSSRSRVFAYKSELDQWLRDRANGHTPQSAAVWVRRKAFPALVALFLVGLVALSVWYFALRRPSGVRRSVRQVSIAVLPFADADGPEHEAYYAEGITQEIIKSLRIYDGLTIIPIPTVLRKEAPFIKPEVMGRELGLDYILKGFLDRQKDGVFLAVEFIKAKDETRLWDSRYAEPLKNLATVANDIQTRVCRTLKIKVNRGSPGPQEQDNINDLVSLEDYFKANFVSSRLEAQNKDPWLLYHQGRFYGQQFTVADNELAINLFQQALDLEPQYAEAYVGLAGCYSDYISFNWDFDIQWLNKAEELLNKAQALSPGLPEYYSSLLTVDLLKEFIFNQDREREIQVLAREGLDRFPNDQNINGIIGVYYFRRFGRDGKPADLVQAADCKKRAFWLNPYAFNNIVYAEILLLNREFDQALQVCRLAEKLDSSLAARFLQGEVYYYRGDLDQSRSLFMTFDALPRLRVMSLYYLAMIQARQGHASEAQKIIRQIEILSPGDYRFFQDSSNLASAYFGLGNAELGYRYLDECLKKNKTNSERFINLRYIALDPNFDRYKNEPKFLEFIKAAQQWSPKEKSK